jgi:uncharacterized alpha-E superfamily protein
MGVPDDVAGEHRTGLALLDLLAYDLETSASIAGALVAARENVRGAREALSEEIWECLNATYNDLSVRIASARDFGPAPFFSYVRERTATFAGHVETSLSRDACHDVLVLGRCLERVDMTARLLAARIGAGRESEAWMATLRACSAHDAYFRTYHSGVDPARVLAFLMVDRRFPRSVLHTLNAGEQALARLDPTLGRSTVEVPARRVLGRARTDLEFLSAQRLLDDDLPERLLGLQQTVSTVSEEVTRWLFAGSAPLQWRIEALAL